ncbi:MULTISPECIES: CoA transferase [unclassified Mycobacterium]|uniref:CaiB/BaiF CoA transferase family protein n=1 Tax=unclassified Mycobacterium TaxID=2642494 RepID=UPI0029C6AAFB|nr:MULTISPECIES: CoA transferase [unclassified Mycobacterium]
MGVLDGLEVLDLSRGISGPLSGMLLADQGARVTKIEPPGGDPWRELSGYRVWNRGKRSAFLDLKDVDDHRRFLALAARADVVIESFSPGTTSRLGIDYATLAALNPRLVYCSITGYGPDGPHADRPAIDALVAARTGYQWAGRGTPEGITAQLSGVPGPLPDLDVPPECWTGPDRPGPLFNGVPWISLATFYIATIGVNAALLARETTGRGQHVNASLLHGVLATTLGSWQAAENADKRGFQTWIFDPRAPKGFFRAADDRWTHHWVALPEFILGVADKLAEPDSELVSTKTASLRIEPGSDDIVVLQAYEPVLAEAVRRFPAETWVQLAAETGVPVQAVRSPEEALLDPTLLADGCVVEVDDPEVGPIRQVGRVLELSRHPVTPPRPAVAAGQHTDDVRAEADAAPEPGRPEVAAGKTLSSPLAGVVVLDLGLAVAGPFGTQVLAQLGARVIKVNTARDKGWMRNQIGMCCNRDKESIILNLKDPEALSVLHRLVAKADVVAHNMRYGAAQRLGVDFETLRQIKPDLIYSHSIGHDTGPRQKDPGNDQTASALAGTEWLDGGMDNGGRPIWSTTSLGDTGTGFLSALGVIQALLDRNRTGEGQFVRTSILYAHLLNASTAWASPDGSRSGDRQQPDAEVYGYSALYRLYETLDDWLCLAVFDDQEWRELCDAIHRPHLADDPRFTDSQARRVNDDALVNELTTTFAGNTATHWFDRLDAAGVPCEIADPDFASRLFADPVAQENKLVTAFDHPTMGAMRVGGLYFDLSDTPGTVGRPALTPGQDSRRILTELGYAPSEIDALVISGAVGETTLERV